MPKKRTPQRHAKIQNVLRHRQTTLTIVLANLHDAHNVSAVYRTCDACGVLQIHLYYTNQAFPKIARKTSASAYKWIQTVRHTTPTSLRTALHGFQLLATSCSDTARSFRSYDYTKPTAIILGNEHNGVDPELLPIADGEVYIPMYGMVQSFNVSVAAAFLLSECVRQREETGMYTTPQLSDAVYQELYADWLER